VLETIPVIICTIVDEKNKGFSLGATDYLTKPVDRKRLLELLKSYCRTPPCHVLVVEDDPSSREMVVRMLARTGWFIQQADNGSMALKSIAKQLPDVILLDLMMPEMDGFEFIEKLQQHKEWCKVPVIVVTAKQLSAEDQHRLNGYVTSIINKGKFDSANLLKNISEQLARCISTPVSQDNK
ncbi:MAG: response regulator, partial [Proteobacteria bacterium]|nr:response regulator [Pseudomonadota bacterium]